MNYRYQLKQNRKQWIYILITTDQTKQIKKLRI
jgi:hypothetical protein